MCCSINLKLLFKTSVPLYMHFLDMFHKIVCFICTSMSMSSFCDRFQTANSDSNIDNKIFKMLNSKYTNTIKQH